MQRPEKKERQSSGRSNLSDEQMMRKALIGIGLITGLTLLIAFCCCSCSYINKKFGLKDDNLGEELIEEAIEMKTGLDVDLTPSSPESS